MFEFILANLKEFILQIIKNPHINTKNNTYIQIKIKNINFTFLKKYYNVSVYFVDLVYFFYYYLQILKK